MSIKILTSVSVLALLFGAQMAVAQANNVQANTEASASADVAAEDQNLIEDVKDALGKTKDKIVDATKDASASMNESGEEVQYTVLTDSANDQGTMVTVNARSTADKMLGEPVSNASGERIGTLKDIILDDKGEAVLAIVSDAEFVDLGAKDAAFDYALVTRRDKDGDVIMPLTEETINNTKAFSYDMETADNAETRTMPANGYSVEKLLGTEVLGPDNNPVGDVDNIVLRNGRADTVVVGFDKTLNMGGEKAALPFDDIQIVEKNETEANFQLTASQAAKFETFKENASN